MTVLYYSEREGGERPRDNNEISRAAWGGVQALISSRIKDGSFGSGFPDTCEDYNSVSIGTDADALQKAMQAEIPDLQGDPSQDTSDSWGISMTPSPWQLAPEDMPRTPAVLDMIEFCWRHISKPVSRDYHSFFKHDHLHFDDQSVRRGRREFREDINRIFRRNGIAYELTGEGNIERLVPPVLQELVTAHFQTGDSELDQMLETARRKFLDPHVETRREALGSLWGAWERLKTLGEGQNKRAQITALLDATAGSPAPKFREALEREARELTWIGNSLQIRHSETNQEKITKDEHIDYLFYRLLSLIRLILQFL